MDTDLTRLGAEDIAFHPDEVAQVEQFLEYDVVEIFVLIGTDGIALDVDLYASL